MVWPPILIHAIAKRVETAWRQQDPKKPGINPIEGDVALGATEGATLDKMPGAWILRCGLRKAQGQPVWCRRIGGCIHYVLGGTLRMWRSAWCPGHSPGYSTAAFSACYPGIVRAIPPLRHGPTRPRWLTSFLLTALQRRESCRPARMSRCQCDSVLRTRPFPVLCTRSKAVRYCPEMN